MSAESKLARSQDIATKVSVLFRKRAEHARDEFTQRLTKAAADNGFDDAASGAATAARAWTDWTSYAVDASNQQTLTWNDNDIQDSLHGLKSLHYSDFEVVDLTPIVTDLSVHSGAAQN